jgi:mono/diheme cytochrome c family protein
MKKLLKGAAALVLLLLLAGGSFFGWASFRTNKDLHTIFPNRIEGMDSLVAVADIALGERIVQVRNGCIDCHGADLGGREFINDPAMGVYNSANLTPAGLQYWTNDEIAQAIHWGIGRDGRPLRFMPALEFNALSKQDLAAVIAYLRSLPPVERSRGPLEIGPLAKVLYATGNVPALLSTFVLDLNRDFNTKPVEEPSVAFGEYLAKSACIGCHNPQFSGGAIPGAPPEWAHARSIRLGGKDVWTEEQFIATMRTGISPTTGEEMKFPMPVAMVKNMNDVELRALYAYLSSLN